MVEEGEEGEGEGEEAARARSYEIISWCGKVFGAITG